MKQPVILAISVPNGNPVPNSRAAVTLTPWRSIEPSPPPTNTTSQGVIAAFIAKSRARKRPARWPAFSYQIWNSRRCAKFGLSSASFLEQLIDVIPVHEALDEGLHVVGTAVAVVDVIGVLPHIGAENRRCAVHQRA